MAMPHSASSALARHAPLAEGRLANTPVTSLWIILHGLWFRATLGSTEGCESHWDFLYAGEHTEDGGGS